jgi:hypothetical protein
VEWDETIRLTTWFFPTLLLYSRSLSAQSSRLSFRTVNCYCDLHNEHPSPHQIISLILCFQKVFVFTKNKFYAFYAEVILYFYCWYLKISSNQQAFCIANAFHSMWQFCKHQLLPMSRAYCTSFCHPQIVTLHSCNFWTQNSYTGVPPYLLIQYPRFQLSAVHGSPPKNWKIKEINGS